MTGSQRVARRRTPSRRLVAAAGVLTVLTVLTALMASCSGRGLPDGPEARRTETALAERFSDDDTTCRVNLLGEDADSQYVWLECETLSRAPDGSVTRSGASVPAKISGERVEVPGEGSAYVTDVRRLFPSGVADRILDGENLRP